MSSRNRNLANAPLRMKRPRFCSICSVGIGDVSNRRPNTSRALVCRSELRVCSLYAIVTYLEGRLAGERSPEFDPAGPYRSAPSRIQRRPVRCAASGPDRCSRCKPGETYRNFSMKWVKKGLIYAPDGSVRWARKYAYPASPLLMHDNTLRIYLAFCDDNMVGRAGYVDLDVDNPSVIRGVSSQPVLDIGEPGAFDENGVVPTSVIRVGELIYMYYVGYQLGYKVRYFQFQGLAISADGGNSFTRYSRVPVLDRSDRELLNRASAFVMHDDGIFRMWYVGGSEWITAHGKTLPTYNMRYLESADGKTWGKEGRVCLVFQNDNTH